MSEKAYEVAHIDDLDRYPVDDEGPLWRPVRRRLGITAFGVNAFTVKPGGNRITKVHSEQGGHEELYFVASGRATFTLGDEEIDAPAGTFIHALPGTKRGGVATEPKTTVVVFGATPGVPHEISSWEELFIAFAHVRSGDEEEGRRVLAQAIGDHTDAWESHYDTACFESLTKNREASLEHLKRAIELEPKAREYAHDDKDFDWLRDDPEFPA